jgi:hypothetical protein
VTLPDCGVTAKATAFEASEAFATETVMVVALATSCVGTFTARATQKPPAGQFVGVAELGIRTALPNFTWDVIPRPVPMMVKMKFPLPAGTLVGEIAAIVGCTVCGGGVVEVMEFPPQPESNRGMAEVSTALRSTESPRMEHRPRACKPLEVPFG